MKQTFEQLRERYKSANEKLGDLYIKAANRELTPEEKMEEINLTREINQCKESMQGINLELENAKATASRSKAMRGESFREYLKNVRKGSAEREILLAAASPAAGNSIAESGAINLSIHDIIPTLNEGLGLPAGLKVVTGVIGNELWPVSVDDVEMEEVGEVASLNDQVLHFEKIVPTSRRVGLTVPVSNRAIDNAAFDVMLFVQTKFELATKKYLASKIYSLAAFTGNKGPYANKKASATNLTIDENAYKNILTAIAGLKNVGFMDGDICLSMDAVTEAELKATPKAQGQGGFVIENGKCAGYPYTVSHFVNTELDSADALVPTDDRYIEIGCWNYFALQQHDEVRLTVDATSQGVAKKNITAITLNTAWSMTDLSVYINGSNNASTAFKLYKVVEPEPSTV
jgi:hypothetical protein